MAEVDADEAKAREKGWQDLDAWKEAGRDPADHVDAKTFNIRGEFIGQSMQQQREIADLKAKIDRIGETFAEEKKRSYERGKEEALRRHEKALEEGDNDAAKAAVKDLEKLADERPREVPDDSSRIAQWQRDNAEWYYDPEAFDLASKIDAALAARRGGITDIEAHLSEVKAEVARRLPKLFENPNRASAPAVETPSRTVSTKEKKPGYEDMPDYMKSACDTFVRDGVMTREEYVQAQIEAGEL